MEQGIISPAPVRLAGNVRAWPVSEANADHRRRPRRAHPVETAAAHIGNQLLHARLGRPHRPADVGDGEAQAKYDIYVNYDLCGKQLRTGSRRGECEQTPECRREHRRPPAR